MQTRSTHMLCEPDAVADDTPPSPQWATASQQLRNHVHDATSLNFPRWSDGRKHYKLDVIQSPSERCLCTRIKPNRRPREPHPGSGAMSANLTSRVITA